MGLFLIVVQKKHAPQCLVEKNLSTIGEIIYITKSQHLYLRRNILMNLWIGLIFKLMMHHYSLQMSVREFTDYISILGVPFPKNYISVVRKIFGRLFRVFVHVYIHHFDRLHAIGAVCLYFLYTYFQEAHVNTCYKHFYHFVTYFSIIDKKELEPLVIYFVYIF